MNPFAIQAVIQIEPLIVAAIVIASPIYRVWCWIADMRHPDDISAWDGRG